MFNYKISLPNNIGYITIDKSLSFKDRIAYFERKLINSEEETKILKEIISSLRED